MGEAYRSASDGSSPGFNSHCHVFENASYKFHHIVYDKKKITENIELLNSHISLSNLQLQHFNKRKTIFTIFSKQIAALKLRKMPLTLTRVKWTANTKNVFIMCSVINQSSIIFKSNTSYLWAFLSIILKTCYFIIDTKCLTDSIYLLLISNIPSNVIWLEGMVFGQCFCLISKSRSVVRL